jgi:UDP-N-acetylmuramyl pentapeptide phosphotransferase/UDP-N-acetylglucosamine-1-phosphate transferase
LNRLGWLLTIGVVVIALIVGGLVVMNIVEEVREFERLFPNESLEVGGPPVPDVRVLFVLLGVSVGVLTGYFWFNRKIGV